LNHDQTDGHRPNSDFKITNGYFKAGYSFNEHFHATADFSLADYEAGDPGPDTLNAKTGERIDITRGYGAFTLQNEFDKVSGSLKLFYNFGEHNITDGFHSTDNNFGLNFYEAFSLFKGNTITAGADFNQYGGMAENVKAMNGKGIVFADTAVNETGVYTFIQQKFLEKITLNAGIRFQNHSIYGNQWIPSAGFAWNFNELTTWKGSISKGFRSPTIRELFLWGPNPTLDPESIISYETGLSKWFFSNKINAEVTIYHLSGDNLIIMVPQKGLQNAGEVNNTGVELAVNAAPAKNLELNATYSYINMENPVYATPEHHLFLNATYQLKKWQLNANIQQISNLDNDASAVVNLESYTLLNAKISYNLLKGLNLFASGENLFSQDYQVNRYYTMPGATVFGGVSYSF
jgi:iron complex outermembrane receptor protein